MNAMVFSAVIVIQMMKTAQDSDVLSMRLSAKDKLNQITVSRNLCLIYHVMCMRYYIVFRSYIMYSIYYSICIVYYLIEYIYFVMY